MAKVVSSLEWFNGLTLADLSILFTDACCPLRLAEGRLTTTHRKDKLSEMPVCRWWAAQAEWWKLLQPATCTDMKTRAREKFVKEVFSLCADDKKTYKWMPGNVELSNCGLAGALRLRKGQCEATDKKKAAVADDEAAAKRGVRSSLLHRVKVVFLRMKLKAESAEKATSARTSPVTSPPASEPTEAREAAEVDTRTARIVKDKSDMLRRMMSVRKRPIADKGNDDGDAASQRKRRSKQNSESSASG